MRPESLLLLYAALFARPSSAAAVRYDNLHPRQDPSLNGTVTTSSPSPSTTTSSEAPSSISNSDQDRPDTTGGRSYHDPPGSTTTTTTTTTSRALDSTVSTVPSTSSTQPSSISTKSVDTTLSTQSETDSANSTSIPPTWTSTISTASECDFKAPNATCSNTFSTQSHEMTAFPSITSEPCTPLPPGEPFTVFSIVHTATITFMGNRSDYTAPFVPIQVPTYCNDTLLPPQSSRKSTWTGTRSDRYGGGDGGNGPPDGYITSHVAASSVATVDNPFLSEELPPYASRTTTTFVTTDKNPSVIYPSDPPPNYSQPPGIGGGPDGGIHKTVGGGDDGRVINDPPRPTYTVTAGDNTVIINDSTYSNLKPGQTATVTVGDGTFTIYPTAVVGEGVTFAKPEPGKTDAGAPAPTSKLLDGAQVVVSGTNAVVDGTTLAIPTDGTATIIGGKSVSAGPGTIVVGGQTLTFEETRAQQTDVVVAGGEMLTAIGPSVLVIHSTTLTYGPGIDATTKVVDDDTISIGPSGVVVHGSTLGGPDADATDTTYEIVGGASITEVGESLVVINGTTFTVGPSADTVTTVIGGETITIGPDGVVVSTMTLSFPFGSVVTTIMPSGTWGNDMPMETGSVNANDADGDGDGDGDDDNAGMTLRPSREVSVAGLCIAIGVWVFI